jgi:hypothetical protein
MAVSIWLFHFFHSVDTHFVCICPSLETVQENVKRIAQTLATTNACIINFLSSGDLFSKTLRTFVTWFLMANTKDIVYLLMLCNQSSNLVTYLHACSSKMYEKSSTFDVQLPWDFVSTQHVFCMQWVVLLFLRLILLCVVRV